jgi:hypothetical protein
VIGALKVAQWPDAPIIDPNKIILKNARRTPRRFEHRYSHQTTKAIGGGACHIINITFVVLFVREVVMDVTCDIWTFAFQS